MVTVAIAQHAEIEVAIREALDHLACESLIRGKLVAVKPNDTWASASDKTGVTQPRPCVPCYVSFNVMSLVNWSSLEEPGRQRPRRCFVLPALWTS